MAVARYAIQLCTPSQGHENGHRESTAQPNENQRSVAKVPAVSGTEWKHFEQGQWLRRVVWLLQEIERDNDGDEAEQTVEGDIVSQRLRVHTRRIC